MRKKRISSLRFMSICGFTIASAYLVADLTGVLADLFDFQEIVPVRESVEGIVALIIALIWSNIFFHYNIVYEEVSKLFITTTSDEKFLTSNIGKILGTFIALGVIPLYCWTLQVHLYRNVSNNVIIISMLLLTIILMIIPFTFGIIKLFSQHKEKIQHIDSKENYIMIPLFILSMLELIYLVKYCYGL